MPVTRKHSKPRRRPTLASLSLYDVFYLLTGHLRTNLDSVTELRSEADAVAFYRENRAAFDTTQGTGHATELAHDPGQRNWLWWKLDAPEPRDDTIPEFEQLKRMGLLSDFEGRLALAARVA